MNRVRIISLIAVLIGQSMATAQIVVTVSSPKLVGQMAVVPLALENRFTEEVESARAAVFLIDEEGKMIGQATKWVIGGSPDNPVLAAKATNVFYFVISSDKSFGTTNLTAKVTFSRLILAGGRFADPVKDVNVTAGVK